MRKLFLLSIGLLLFNSCIQEEELQECGICNKLYYFAHESVPLSEADLVKIEPISHCKNEDYDPEEMFFIGYPYTFYRIDCSNTITIKK